jgi:hypothetical protein
MIEKVSIAEVKANKVNPRTIKDVKFKKLVESIKKFPEMLKLRPIVVNNEGIILGGNMRYRASVAAGLKEVWILKAEGLTEQQQKEFVIKDNVGFGEWDWEVVANLWDDLPLEEWGLDLIGFSDVEDLGTSFTLPSGAKNDLEQITFTLSSEQAIEIKEAIDDIKQTSDYLNVDTMGNSNTNGNAIFAIVKAWKERTNN